MAADIPIAHDTPVEGTRRTRQLTRPLTWVREAGGIAGSIAAVLALVFLIRPGCQPAVDQLPAEQAGRISDLVAEPMPYGEYLRRLGSTPQDPTSPELARLGYRVSFDFRITGYAAKRLPVRWAIVDRDLGRQVAASRPDSQFLVPEATTDQARSPDLWLPAPLGEREFIVEVSVFQPNGVFPLAPIARSRPLAGASEMPNERRGP